MGGINSEAKKRLNVKKHVLVARCVNNNLEVIYVENNDM